MPHHTWTEMNHFKWPEIVFVERGWSFESFECLLCLHFCSSFRLQAYSSVAKEGTSEYSLFHNLTWINLNTININDNSIPTIKVVWSSTIVDYRSYPMLVEMKYLWNTYEIPTYVILKKILGRRKNLIFLKWLESLFTFSIYFQRIKVFKAFLPFFLYGKHVNGRKYIFIWVSQTKLFKNKMLK